MGLRRIWQHRHRLADQLNRALGAPLAKSEESEQVKRVGVVGIFIKDFTVKSGGSLEAPSLVVLKGRCQFRHQSRLAPGHPIANACHAPPIPIPAIRTVRGLPL
jgi:hypothetical protein